MNKSSIKLSNQELIKLVSKIESECPNQRLHSKNLPTHHLHIWSDVFACVFFYALLKNSPIINICSLSNRIKTPDRNSRYLGNENSLPG